MGFGRNIIEYNEIHDPCHVMADAGGIYCNRYDASMNSNSRGNRFERNIIYYDRPEASLLRMTPKGASESCIAH
jgi:hypothetical protein